MKNCNVEKNISLLIEVCHGHQHLYNIVSAFKENAFKHNVPLPIFIVHYIK
jgi:hypothetical protein